MDNAGKYMSRLRILLCKFCGMMTSTDRCPACLRSRQWVSLQELLGGHDKEPEHAVELTAEVLTNLAILGERVNKLLSWAMPLLPEFECVVTSGWRPESYNKAIGGAPGSKHIRGMAVDILDEKGLLNGLLKQNVKKLEELDLAIEAREATPSWCHIQVGAPKSGHRVFFP